MGDRPKKGSRCLHQVLNFVGDDFRGLRCQGEEGKKIAAPSRIRPESAFEASKGVFVFEQRDYDALVRGMLPLAEPGVSTARCRFDCRGVASEDSESLDLLALPESKPSESEEHGGASAPTRKELAGTGNFISARGRRARRVQPEGHRGRPAEVREVRLRQGLLRPTRPRKLSDPRLRLPEV